MDQLQSNEDELQRAINDITQNNLEAMPAAAPVVDMPVVEAPEPVAPEMPEMVVPEPVMPEAPEVAMPEVGPIPEPAMPEVAPAAEAPVIEAPKAEAAEITSDETEAPVIEELATNQDIKQKALRELAPLLGKMNINPEQKFQIFLDMVEVLNDKTVVNDAYEAAKQITDENKKGEALLKIIEIIG